MWQLNFLFISKMLGLMLIIETFFLGISTGVAALFKGDDIIALGLSSVITLVFGFIFYWIGAKANDRDSGKREGLITVSLTWIVFSLFGMLPYLISGYIPSVTDAYFETMSGFTTTGATILTEIEPLPKGLLFWRSLTQWLGGMGMIVFTLALMPIFGGGAAQLFDAETTGISQDRFLPRVTQVAKRLWGIYFFITVVLVGMLWAGPMNLYDSVCHAFTTMSTGGYSTKNASIAHWNSPYIEYVITFFMFVGGTNFTLLYFLFSGYFKKLFGDEELRWYFYFVVGATAIVTGGLLLTSQYPSVEVAFRKSIFQVVSIITTTGFATADYIPWGPFFWLVMLFLMTVCGCAGSTCGGMKMVRFVVLAKNTANEFKKQTHPKAIIPVRLNNHAISMDTVQKILAFVFVYIGLIFLSSILLSASGMGFPESVGGAVTCVSNTGPALGELGPVGNFSQVPMISKWYMSFLMLVGRLEIFTVLTLLTPGFWKQ